MFWACRGRIDAAPRRNYHRSLEQAVAAPFATRNWRTWAPASLRSSVPETAILLAVMMRPFADYPATSFGLNRSKESLTLDLKRAEAKLVLHRLLEKADVFVQNWRPGRPRGLALARRNCAGNIRVSCLRPVWLWIFGAVQRQESIRSADPAETGLISITGTEQTPSKVGISIADISCGMYAIPAF